MNLLSLTLGGVMASHEDENAHLPNISDVELESALSKIGREYVATMAKLKPMDEYDYWLGMQQFCERWCDNLVKSKGDAKRLHSPIPDKFFAKQFKGVKK